MKHNRHAEAFVSMQRLRAHPIIAARDFYYSYVIYEVELKEAGNTTYWTRMRDCFTVPRIRRANYGASTVMIAQQMCGINSMFRFDSSATGASSNTLQSSLFTALQSLKTSVTQRPRHCMHLWAMVLFRSWPPSQPYL
jgi:hypothetical protein